MTNKELINEIMLETKIDAGEVLYQLKKLISMYEHATIADLKDLIGVSGDFNDLKYGWTKLDNAMIFRVGNAWKLKLPVPELLEDIPADEVLNKVKGPYSESVILHISNKVIDYLIPKNLLQEIYINKIGEKIDHYGREMTVQSVKITAEEIMVELV